MLGGLRSVSFPHDAVAALMLSIEINYRECVGAAPAGLRSTMGIDILKDARCA